MDLAQARFNMIEQQIRTWAVLDQRVLDTLALNPREDYAPKKYRDLAFADLEIPIGHHQAMMTPKFEARLLQALNVQQDDKALEIGTGSGYLTACLASLADHVLSVDIYGDFTTQAGYKLAAHDKENVSLRSGDAAHGWEMETGFDAIAVTGSLPIPHNHFHQQLNIGGRLFLITGTSPVMDAQLVTRIGEHEWSTESLFETDLPALENADQPKQFVF